MARKVLMLFAPAVLLALLAACGAAPVAPAATAPPAPPTAPALPTAAPAPTEAPTAAPAAPAATEAPTAAPAAPAATASPAAAAPATGARVFQIVPDQTEASYAVQETFLRQNLPAEAIGKTSVISGEFRFSADGKPTGEVTRITVDISTLKSDSDRRDNALRTRWLESASFPLAEFTSTSVEGVPNSYTEGEEVTFKLIGDLKIRDVTRQVTWDVTGKLEGDTVTGTATTEIMMKDFGFDPPSIGGFVAVKDGVKVTVNFTAKEKDATQ